jgi:hypothetical protein
MIKERNIYERLLMSILAHEKRKKDILTSSKANIGPMEKRYMYIYVYIYIYMKQ